MSSQYTVNDDLELVYDSLLEPYTVDENGYEVHFLVADPLKWRILEKLGHEWVPACNLYLMWYYDNGKMLATVEFGYGPGEVDLTFEHGFETEDKLDTSLVYWLAGLR